MMLKKIMPLLLFVHLVSCNNEDGNLIVEPSGAAEYYINNTTEMDLTVVITTSVELGSIDSTTTALKNQSSLIYTDGIIGVNPVPTNTFENIKLYSKTSDINSLLLEFSPVANEDWDLIDQVLNETGYGLTKYELLITDQIINDNQ